VKPAWIPPTWLIPKVNVNVILSKTYRRGSAIAFSHDNNGDYLGALSILLDGIIDPNIIETFI
jgi:hypothetical protein